jgi:small subunit ribosomal protein S2
MQSQDAILIPYDDMLKAGMHFGRKRTVFSPRMNSCVFTVRDGICIIDLLKTQERLGEAIAFLKQALSVNGLLLFVAPTKQSQESVRALADAVNMPYVTERWIGGTLTNFKAINGRVKRLVDMEQARATGGWEKYTKKERVVLEKELEKMRVNFEGLKKLTRMEARKMGVKVVAVGNTDASPEGIEHVICANDRSKKSVDLLVNAIRAQLATGN